jgi:hypothetical protein
MDRLRTVLALAGITLMTAMIGSAGMTGAYAEDFQAQGSHLNDPANQRNLNDQQDPKTSRLNDPANARNINDSADRRDPADARGLDDKASKRDVK